MVIQVAFYRGWIRDVDLVSEALDMQEGEYTACVEHQPKNKIKRGSSRHLDALQDSTNADVDVLRRHVFGLCNEVRKGAKHRKT